MTISCDWARSCSNRPSSRCRFSVVERRLHLVHDVERRRAGPEDGHQHRHRGQRLLPTGQQRQPFDLLAGRTRLHLDAGGEHVVGVGEPQPALAAGEQRGEHPAELTLHIGVGVGEHLQDARVDVGHDVEQVFAGGLDVLELGGQEVVALLQRGELLQRQRVDPAQLGQLSFGAFGATLLGGPVERHRRRRGHLLAALAGLLVFGDLELGRRQRRPAGRIRRPDTSGAMPNCSSTICSSCSMRSAACALATSSRCSDSVSVPIRAPSVFTSSRTAAIGRRPLLAFGGQHVAVCATLPRPPDPAARPAAARRRQPRRPPRPRAGARRGPAGRAPSPPVPRRQRDAANPPVRERHWRVLRRSAPPTGLPPRRRGRPRPPRRSAAGSTGLGRDVLGLFDVAQPGLEFTELAEGFRAPGLQAPPVGAAACATPRRRRGRPGPAARAARRSPRWRHRTR